MSLNNGMRHEGNTAQRLSLEVFLALSPPVRIRREIFPFSLPCMPIERRVVEVFLGNLSPFLSTWTASEEVNPQSGRMLWRAFSFSKSHARCLMEHRGWRRCVGGFI
jgi:hypothetical protein